MVICGYFYHNLLDAIAGKAELHVKAEEALRVLRIIELAFQSSREGARFGLPNIKRFSPFLCHSGDFGKKWAFFFFCCRQEFKYISWKL